jgi:hypothetical protein
MLQSYLSHPQPAGLVPRTYMPHMQGGPVTFPGTGYHFHPLLPLAGPTVKSSPRSNSSHSRGSVGQSVLLSGHHLEPATNYSFTSMENIFRHLRFSSCGALSLTRGRVCSLTVQPLPGLASVITRRSKSRRPSGHILLSHSRLISLLAASHEVTIPYPHGYSRSVVLVI